MNKHEAIMEELLYIWDWHIRNTILGQAEDYEFGYADGIGQCILNIGRALGEDKAPYKYEAYKRVMYYDTTANYIKQYPKRLEKNYA